MAIIPRIAAVSYLNTIPFIYGIEHEGNFRADLLLTPPAQCAENYMAGKADIALLPAAVVPDLRMTDIVTDYCIGASGAVRTVVVVSDTPIEQVRRIWLDSHSRTSVQLAGYLAAKKWKIAPEWLHLDDYTLLDNPAEGDAYLIIGDKVFDNEGKFRYSYDLAEEWRKLTRMPFAFAVWVARKGTSYEITDALQHALTYGVEHIYESIASSPYAGSDGGLRAYDYLTRNIDFIFDDEKHRALKKFWDAGLRIVPRSY
ncbi:MAG: menaquinone biosynthesis protein [Alistipes sp.]|nr:menaquinone biosynthesis protein [Alistipes sp.]MDE7129709.1 menaquinone biosynthesis protein [Alistipes sp.]